MNEVIAAIIGLVGTLFGAIIAVFGHELIDKLGGNRGPHAVLAGQWKCDWYIDHKLPGNSLYESDTVEILEVRGTRIKARGLNPKCVYCLLGHVSPVNVLTLLYVPESKQQSLSGVIILKASPLGDSMGWWRGYTREGEIDGGRTTWKQVK